MFDVDRFKQVNDTRGHLFGDHLLAATADAMAACLSDDCSLYRVGGDEFAAILPAVPGDGGGDAASHDRRARRRRPLDAGAHGAGISAGLAWQGEREDPLETLRRADEALYVAKGTGGGCAGRGAPARSSQAAAADLLPPDA